MTTWPGTSIPKSAGNAFDWRAGMGKSTHTIEAKLFGKLPRGRKTA